MMDPLVDHLWQDAQTADEQRRQAELSKALDDAVQLRAELSTSQTRAAALANEVQAERERTAIQRDHARCLMRIARELKEERNAALEDLRFRLLLIQAICTAGRDDPANEQVHDATEGRR